MSTPWYADGLRFTCTRCGKCCTGEPGFVWVNDEEIQSIAEHLELSIEEVVGRFTRVVNGKRTLREKLNNDCVFFDAQEGCFTTSAHANVAPGRFGRVISRAKKTGIEPKASVLAPGRGN